MEGVVGVVGGNLDILSKVLPWLLISCLLVSFTNHVGLAALFHVDGADDIVLRQQLVVDGLGIDLVFAFVAVLDEVLLLGKFLNGAYHLLTLGLAVGADARGNLLVVVGVEGIVGKDFEYLFC